MVERDETLARLQAHVVAHDQTVTTLQAQVVVCDQTVATLLALMVAGASVLAAFVARLDALLPRDAPPTHRAVLQRQPNNSPPTGSSSSKRGALDMGSVAAFPSAKRILAM